MEGKSSKVIFYFLVFIIVLLAALGGGYYYMVKFSGMSLNDVSNKIESQLMQRDEVVYQSNLDSKDKQIELLKAQSNSLRKEQESVPAKLLYTIKPRDKIVAHCVDMKIGRWNMPKHCLDELTRGIADMVHKDKKIVAFEVSGVVDSLPYAGLSPELKQEGLASFRAREAIYIVGKNLPNIAVFEGLSQQKAKERGFVVRAFYVE
ncbi:hypothetical protein [uncultured Helicobacter sp.]|uniref:hypothetical protein n=1 Tax=uncultured Helicobacter sp. TaxID=175537 RepID=UPI002614EF8C|nr:hypothetical protein [uncultured Helicobacter sp.]